MHEHEAPTTQGRDPAAIHGVAGILIWTDNLAAMTAFYTDVLGLVPRTRNDHLTSFVWGDFKLNLSVHSDIHGPAREPLRIMVNLLVEDIGAVVRRLEDAGVRFERRPEQEPWRGWLATFRDPDGNILQLLQPGEYPHPDPA